MAKKELSESRTLEIPAHVSAYLAKQVPSITRGFEHIQTLSNESEFSELDIMLEGTEQGVRIIRGYLLRRYKKVSEPRTFAEFLRKREISRSTAYDYIAESEVFDRLTDENACAVVAALGSMKVRALRNLTDDELNNFVDGAEVRGVSRDEAIDMNASDFSRVMTQTEESIERDKEIQRLKAKLADTETKKSTEEAQRKKLQAMLDLRREDSGFPDFYLITREESRAMATQAEMALEQMAALFNEEIQRANHARNSDDVQHYCERGLATLYSHVYGTACRYAELARRMMESIPLEITDDLGAKLPYTPQEVAIGLERHTMMMAEFKAQASARQDARDDAKPRGKGRPKNKKSEA